MVASGQKTATAAQERVYSYYEIDRPEVGDVEIICDFEGNLLAVIEIVDLSVVPFEKVDADFAPGSGQIVGEFGRVATLLLGWLL